MEKAIKAFLMLMIAIVVFLGGLLISKGLSDSKEATMIRSCPVMENSEGSAL